MSPVENDTAPKMKRAKQIESEREGNVDRLSDLPDCLLLHILTFVHVKHAIRTSILSTRWKHLWKRLPALTLHSPGFGTYKRFSKFVSNVLSHRDGSAALHTLDFDRHGFVEPDLLKSVLGYAISHNVQRLGIYTHCVIDQVPPCIASCQTLTSLKLSVFNGGNQDLLFPKYLSLPALTSLHLQYFAFCASDNDRAEPFSTFKKLNTLFIHNCYLKDAQILCISSTALANLTLLTDYPTRRYSYKIALSTPYLCSFAFTGVPCQRLSGSNVSSLEQVNIDAELWSTKLDLESPIILFSWLLELSNMKSLTVSASTLQVLFLIPGLLKFKHPRLGNLKSLKVKVKVKPLSHRFAMSLRAVKSEKAKWKPSSLIPDGIVDFLLQNSPSAEVAIMKF